MKKSLIIIGMIFVGVLIYTSYASVDQYLFKPTTTNYQGSLKSVRMDTDGKLYTVNTSGVESDTLNCGSADLTLDTLSTVGFKLFGTVWELISINNINSDRN